MTDRPDLVDPVPEDDRIPGGDIPGDDIPDVNDPVEPDDPDVTRNPL